MNRQSVKDLLKDKKFEEALKICKKWVNAEPKNGEAYAYTAFAHDSLGYEREAIPYYEKALTLDLPPPLRREVLLGLGSTYRSIGNYDKAKEILNIGMKEFPDAKEFLVFYSIVLHNLNQHTEALSMLLKTLIETTTNKDIKKYERALSFYADHLDEIW